MNKKIIITNSFFIFNFLIFIINSLFEVPILGLYDEVLAVLCLFYIIYIVAIKGKTAMNFLILGLLLLCILGLLGNVVFNVNGFNLKNIFLDVFIFFKPYLYFIATYFYLRKYFNTNLLKILRIISIFFLSLLFLGCIFYLVGLGNFTDKFGKFVFYNGFSGNIANAVIIFTIILFLLPSKWNLLFFALSMFIMYFNGSAAGLLGLFIIFVLLIFTKIKFNVFYLIPFAIVAILMSYNEITGYLFNPDAPRNKMFYYSFITANQFFPLGGGFGSFGSYMAANNYSELYYQYGFNHMWGMGPEASGVQFLFDTYYPMIIGQFGYIGFIIYLVILIRLFFKFIMKTCKRGSFNAPLAMFAYILVMGLGFNIGGAAGCFMYGVFALTICSNLYINKVD